MSVVNPRYARNINAGLRRQPSVAAFAWYVSSDDYFSSFPVVRSMRGMVVSDRVFNELAPKMKSHSI